MIRESGIGSFSDFTQARPVGEPMHCLAWRCNRCPAAGDSSMINLQTGRDVTPNFDDCNDRPPPPTLACGRIMPAAHAILGLLTAPLFWALQILTEAPRPLLETMRLTTVVRTEAAER